MTDARRVGDWRIPTISISTDAGLPASGIVTCAIIRGDDTATTVVMTAGTPTATATPWTGALYQLTVAGQWVERFTITGDGKGEAENTFWVAASVTDAPTFARTYATTADYGKAGMEAPPTGTDLRRVLRTASARVDEMLTGAIYATNDVTLLPTDAAVTVALRDATVLQANYQIETGDPYGTGATDDYQSVSAGGISLVRGSSGSGGASATGRYGADAYEVLRAAGLTGVQPLSVGALAWWAV